MMKKYNDYIRESKVDLDSQILSTNTEIQNKEYELAKLLDKKIMQFFEEYDGLDMIDNPDVQFVNESLPETYYKEGTKKMMKYYNMIVNMRKMDVILFGEFETMEQHVKVAKEENVNFLDSFVFDEMYEMGIYNCQSEPENILENGIIQDYCLSTFEDKYIDMTKLLQKYNCKWLPSIKKKYDYLFDADELGLI